MSISSFRYRKIQGSKNTIQEGLVGGLVEKVGALK